MSQVGVTICSLTAGTFTKSLTKPSDGVVEPAIAQSRWAVQQKSTTLWKQKTPAGTDRSLLGTEPCPVSFTCLSRSPTCHAH